MAFVANCLLLQAYNDLTKLAEREVNCVAKKKVQCCVYVVLSLVVDICLLCIDATEFKQALTASR